jgi:hypothetical protein
LISDSDSTYTREDISKLFLKWVGENDNTISVCRFQKSIGVSTRTIQSIYGSQKLLINLYKEDIKEIEISRCFKHFSNLIKIDPNKAFRRKFFSFYKRSPTIINRYFGSFGNFTKEFYLKFPNMPKPNHWSYQG